MTAFYKMKEYFRHMEDEQESNWHQHPYGNGWVKNTATVDETAYIGPEATVCDYAKVVDYAQIRDRGSVREEAVVKSNAVVRDRAQVRNYASLTDRACASGKSIVRDNAKMFDYARIYGKAVLQGRGRLVQRAHVHGFAIVRGNGIVGGYAIVKGDAIVEDDMIVDFGETLLHPPIKYVQIESKIAASAEQKPLTGFYKPNKVEGELSTSTCGCTLPQTLCQEITLGSKQCPICGYDIHHCQTIFNNGHKCNGLLFKSYENGVFVQRCIKCEGL